MFESCPLKSHWAMFKLGAKNVLVICHLVKSRSAVKSADRCFSDLCWICGDISTDEPHNFEHLGHFRVSFPVTDWYFLIKVWTFVSGLSCWLRTMRDHEIVCPKLEHGVWLNNGVIKANLNCYSRLFNTLRTCATLHGWFYCQTQHRWAIYIALALADVIPLSFLATLL